MSITEYAKTDREREVCEAVEKHGGIRPAARALKVKHPGVHKTWHRVKDRAASKGYSPEHDMLHTVPDGFKVKGVSSLYGDDGRLKAQWVKSTADQERQAEMMRAAVEALKEDVEPIKPVKLRSKAGNQDLLNLYTLTDIHIGMLAWAEEGGADWDLKIAEQTIVDAFAYLMEVSPAAEVGFFNQLGDALHSDGLLPITPTSHHVLDQDGRFVKVVRAAIRIFRRVIQMMLEKYPKVVVLMAQGNHDLASSVWLQELFGVCFEGNPRVEVIKSPLPYYAYQHGDAMLGFHHGHKANPSRLPSVFMGQFREMFGRTKATFIHCGHRHHHTISEFSGGKVEQHPTLAARDAHASHGGWDALRGMFCITYHLNGYELGRMAYSADAQVVEDGA